MRVNAAVNGISGTQIAAIVGRRRRRVANANDAVSNLETEDGDNLLLETGDFITMEA